MIEVPKVLVVVQFVFDNKLVGYLEAGVLGKIVVGHRSPLPEQVCHQHRLGAVLIPI